MTKLIVDFIIDTVSFIQYCVLEVVKMKRTLKIIIFSAFCTFLFAFCANAEEAEATGKFKENIYYSLNGNTLTISGTGAMPETNGDIEEIPWSAESVREKIENIVIEDGVTTISYCAFVNFENLKSVQIPESVTSMTGCCFVNCSSLEKVVLPQNLENLGFSTFTGCTSLTEINIPKKIKSIEALVFAYCYSLHEITLPENLESIDYAAFSYTGIKNIYIPKNVKYISEIAFTYMEDYSVPVISNIFVDEDNEAYCDIDGVLYSKDKTKLITYPHGKDEKFLTILEGVVNLGYASMFYSRNVETLIVPESVSMIDEGAFYGCDTLTDVYYLGTEEQWKQITIKDSNECLLNATIHFAHKHEYVKEILVEATCDKEGVTLYTCKCGDSYTEIIAPRHTDENGNSYCDLCNENLKESKTLFEILLALINAVIDFFRNIFVGK